MEKGTMTGVSGYGMKILGTHPVHIGMLLVLLLSVGESVIAIQVSSPMCDGHAIKNSESSLAQWSQQLWRNSTIFYRLARAHQPRNRLRENYFSTLELQWPACVAQQENAHAG